MRKAQRKMPIDKLKRVMWLLREQYPNREKYTSMEIRKAIIEEVGYDERTFKRAIKALIQIGILKRLSRWWYKDTEYSPSSERVASKSIHPKRHYYIDSCGRKVFEEDFDMPQGAGRTY